MCVFSVVVCSAEQLQQLLVLLVDEVSRPLPAVVLQLGVSTQREQVAAGDTAQISDAPASQFSCCSLCVSKRNRSPCNVWEPVAAGHVQRGPALLVPLLDVCSVLDQQLHTLQVPRQDGLVDGSHACTRIVFVG